MTAVTSRRRLGLASTRASLDAALTLDTGLLRLASPVRLAFSIVVFLVVGQIAGQLPLAVSAAMGAFMCGFADQSDAYPLRFRLMGITAVAVAVAAFLGGQISESHVGVIVVSAIVAALCGFAFAFGIETGLVGVLALVTFTIFAGTAVGEGVVIEQTAAVLLGAGTQLALAVAGWPLRRCGGARGQLADAWRSMAVALKGPPRAIFSTVLAVRLVHAAGEIDATGAHGETSEWLSAVLSDVDAIRIPLAGLSARLTDESIPISEGERAAVEEFRSAVGVFCRRAANTLVLRFRRRGLKSAIAAVQVTGERARTYAPEQVDVVVSSLTDASERLQGTWPIGRNGSIRLRPAPVRTPTWPELRNRMRVATDARRHAVRLSAATSAAWIVGDVALANHKYWVPLTVAWVARPGFGVTLGRVVARTAGTLLGLGAVSILVIVLRPGPWTVIVVCAIAAYILYAAFPVNYAFAVVFITILVVFLIGLAGSSFEAAIGQRALGTVLGAVIAFLAAYVGTSPVAPTLVDRLLDVVRGGRELSAHQVEGGVGDVLSLTQLITARAQLSAAIDAAKFEPPPPGPSPDEVKEILDDVLMAMFEVAAIRAGTHQAFGIEIDGPGLDQDWAQLEDVLVGRGPKASVEVGSGLDPARTAVRRAIAAADRAVR